jgi:hypothetical protein
MKGSGKFVDLTIYRRIILNLILENYDAVVWIGLVCLRIDTLKGLW